MMHDNLFEYVCSELDKLDKKAKSGGLSMAEIQYADLLAHYKKDALAVESMDEGYSGYYPMGGSYRGPYRGRSYATRRDSRGRYSGERGYSRNDLADKIRDLIEDAPDDRTRQEMERLLSKLEA